MAIREIKNLDRDQQAAVKAVRNVVVTAGAGSGKTSVLAARYAWLVMERMFKVERILTLTFTNKAVTEMYGRIHEVLAGRTDNPQAAAAIRDFHKARITTLDSFCAGIVRDAAPRFGIAPDFSIDNGRIRELALEKAVPFVLDNRENPALQVLLSDRRIKTTAEELFAKTVLEYSPISSPLDFKGFQERQGKEILEQWEAKTYAAAYLTGEIKGELENVVNTAAETYKKLRALLDRPIPEIPDIRPFLEKNGFPVPAPAGGEEEPILRRRISVYFQFLEALRSIKIPWNARGMELIREYHRHLQDLYPELQSIANFALQADITAAIFPLIEEFQNRFNQTKREMGLLTFYDTAVLALDALSRYPDIRRMYKQGIDAIMIDEFQDNNSIQRDLIFLLAEEPERNEPGLPGAGELSPDRMFFVGDEKQSVYRFRGADVAVFRSLGDALGNTVNLGFNYRSRPGLIAAFNYIFGGLLPEDPAAAAPPSGGVFCQDTEELPPFEARYIRLSSPGALTGEEVKNPPVHFCFLDQDRLLKAEDPQWLSGYDLEAAFIAAKIRAMVDSGYEIPDPKNGGEKRPCRYGDFAVLQRSSTHQSSLERQCKNFGLPWGAENPKGLFNDGPINDMYNFLRLLVYPRDNNAYAAVIRSPFARLSDTALAICILQPGGAPFDAALEEKLPGDDREQFRRAGQFYRDLAEEARSLSSAELVSELWYRGGYRYETLADPGALIYGELYDYFFELARRCDDQGKTLAEFLDYLDDLAAQEEKAELDIPVEREKGVRLMTIHKSKGLEFPVVFLYGCGSRGKGILNTEAVYYSKTWGLTINLPQAEELPEDKSGNYFFNKQREEEKRQEAAELRRLLYVGMTRAESGLYITASAPLALKDPQGSGDIRQGLRELWAKRQERAKKEKLIPVTFLDLLLPVLCRDGAGEALYVLEAIPVLSREELNRNRRTAGTGGTAAGSGGAGFDGARLRERIREAEGLYAAAEPIQTKTAVTSINASSLRTEEFFLSPDAPPREKDRIRSVLDKAGLAPEEFGTLVHSILEGMLKKRRPEIPPRILAKLEDEEGVLLLARERAEQFFSSDLGRLCLKAENPESEFPLLTLAEGEDAKIAVNGAIDLLFESGGKMYIVDFKTDELEIPERYLGQMALYCRAVKDIFGKEVSPWIFYLRSQRAYSLEGQWERLDIDALVRTALRNPENIP
ncbi:MAG: UvrD-helicase domain-containing protein [Treponema sp.]|jgi:ATP-dependent helicase/nuclease subunit A|nr:UvrD-helicase domain-containing protein [Treponema sp.]